MQNSDQIKKAVKDKYAQIARESNKEKTNCCEPSSTGSCCDKNELNYSIFAEDYSQLQGHMDEADLSLGCGIPTEHAGIRPGDTILDLGSGAGNDVFVARALSGENGRIIGVDMTAEMIEKANRNREKLGFSNVEFRLGDIEALPVDDRSIDVVISNCVLNLVPDKMQAFREIFRVLKPGARFCVSDIVYRGDMSNGLRKSAEMYAGCVSGALHEEEYISVIKECGFSDIAIRTRKRIDLPQDVLDEFSDEIESAGHNRKSFGLYSITVTAFRPEK